MNPILISTKIQVPLLRPNHIKRDRIETRLSKGLISDGIFTRKVTLISAPAGYGKTSLANSWIRDIPAASCWVSIDENDNDPARFLTYLVKALQTKTPDIGKPSLAYLQSPKLPPAEAILAPLINELSILDNPTIIALDDYHIIQRMEIHQCMNFLIQNAPGKLHLMIISREDPPFPLHNLRAKRQMEEIRQADLSFNIEESTDFFSQAYEEDLTEDDVQLINQRTEGWITGIQLTALSLKNRRDSQTILKNIGASTSNILDYLFQEIFQVQSDKYQDFLVKTSILEQISPDLAAAVSGYAESGGMLHELYQSNLFIIPITEDNAWYRYHRLFLELLRQRLRLQKTLSAEVLHRKASEWYEKNGFMDQSIHHTLAGSDWEKAVSHISQQSDKLLKNGRISTLLLWLKKIPTDFYDSSADFCLVYAWPLLLSGQLDEASSYISRAEKAAGGDFEVIGQIAAAQAYLAQAKGNTRELFQYSERALSLLPEDDDSSRGIVALNLGIAYWHAGDMESAEKPLKEANPAAHRSGNTYAEISARLFLARVAAVHGKLKKAAELTRALVFTRRGIPIENLALTDLAMYHYEWGEFEKARKYIDTALEKLQRGSVVEFTLAGLMIKIRILIAQGKMHEAETLIEQCKSYVSNPAMSEQMRSRWAAFNVELALHKGNIKEAKEWLKKNTRQLDAHPFYRFLHLAPIRIQLAENEFVKAREMLAQAHKEAHDHKWGYGMVWLLSHMAATDESEQRALKYLNTALGIGYDGKLIRTFIEAGPKMLLLLRRMAVSYEHPEYLGKIIKAIEIEKDVASLSIENKILSNREKEILRLVTAGFTNRQIAEQLVISISTVKSHIHHICTKLDASNRTQATAKARELGII